MSPSSTDPTIDSPVAVADVTHTHLGADGGPPRDDFKVRLADPDAKNGTTIKSKAAGT